MPRLLFLFSILPILGALAARWYFGLRVLASEGRQNCRCDLERWKPLPGDTSFVHRAEETAAEFGRQLRLKALAEWRELDPKQVRSRETARRFAMAVPPLAGIMLVMAFFAGRLPGTWAIPAFLASVALAVIFDLLSLMPELAAITRIAKKVRQVQVFPRREDEEAVVHCAIAHAWKETLPPILSRFQE